MSRIDFHDLDTLLLSLVADKTIQLSKAPTMKSTFRVSFLSLAIADLGTLPNMSEIFQDDSAARSSLLNDTFGEDMIAIPVESHLLAGELLQVAVGGLCSFRLQFTTETKIAAVYFFPMTIAEEVTAGSDSRAIQSQIHADDFTGLSYSRFGNGDNDVQPELPLPIAQISSRNGMTRVLGTVSRQCEWNADASSAGREAYLLLLPTKHVGLFIVAYWTGLSCFSALVTFFG
jgi:hypothetical protein